MSMLKNEMLRIAEANQLSFDDVLAQSYMENRKPFDDDTSQIEFKNTTVSARYAYRRSVVYCPEPDEQLREHRILGWVKYTYLGWVIKWADNTPDTMIHSLHGKDVLKRTLLIY